MTILNNTQNMLYGEVMNALWPKKDESEPFATVKWTEKGMEAAKKYESRDDNVVKKD